MVAWVNWTTMGVAALSLGGAQDLGDRPLAPTVSASAVSVSTAAWPTYKARLAILARQAGVRPDTVAANVPGLSLNYTAMNMEATEPGAATTSSGQVFAISPYLRRHVNPSIIARGQRNYYEHYAGLQRLEQRTGVDPAVTMAIWGHETSYGQVTGNYDLLEALASLGYYGRRRDFFESEFIAALKLMDQGVPRYRLKGSWAGATGYPQFMPSVALRLRADGDNDGVANIWSDEYDGLASIAMYLRDTGWKPNVPWGVQVNVPLTLNRQAIVSRVKATRCPQVFRRHSRWLTMREWRSLGVTPTRRSLGDNELAFLLEPDGPGQPAYLLTQNYRAILDYNCSNFYAMSVGVLADAIARR